MSRRVEWEVESERSSGQAKAREGPRLWRWCKGARRTASDAAGEEAEEEHAERTHGEDECGGGVGADEDEEREQKTLRRRQAEARLGGRAE